MLPGVVFLLARIWIRSCQPYFGHSQLGFATTISTEIYWLGRIWTARTFKMYIHLAPISSGIEYRGVLNQCVPRHSHLHLYLVQGFHKSDSSIRINIHQLTRWNKSFTGTTTFFLSIEHACSRCGKCSLQKSNVQNGHFSGRKSSWLQFSRWQWAPILSKSAIESY